MAALVVLFTTTAALQIASRSLSVTVVDASGFALSIANQPAVAGGPLTVFVDNQHVSPTCNAPVAVNGSNQWGAYKGVQLACTANGVPGWGVCGYETGSDVDGAILFELSLPNGANGTNVALFDLDNIRPVQFAPFPSLAVTPDNALGTNLSFCYGGDKAHLYRSELVAGNAGNCGGLDGGPFYFAWADAASPTGLAAMIATPANSFHLNFPRVSVPGALFAAKLMHNIQRQDMVFCGSDLCVQVQTASGYTIFSEEGFTPTDNGAVDLTFWWCADVNKNWVTTDNQRAPAVDCGPNHGSAGFLFAAGDQPGLAPVFSYYNAAIDGHMLTGSAAGTSFALSHGYVVEGQIVGYLLPAHGSSPAGVSLTMGVSGEVASLPPGFLQQNLLYHSPNGLNAATDGFGACIRRAYSAQKFADEDIFLKALSIFTDNGAATLGLAWSTKEPAPIYNGPGGFNQMNWSQVQTTNMQSIADQVRATGIAPRGVQLDCWWYPVNVSAHPLWCGTDWVLPEQYFPNGTGGLRAAMGLPLMLYFPAVCTDGGVWAGRYNWSDTWDQGWLLPVTDEASAFFGDLFAYGASLAAKGVDTADPWPGTWAPPLVKEAWATMNMAAYETDFWHNMMNGVPELRTVWGAGERFIEALDAAAQGHNLTVQLCAGNVPSFFKSLALPTMTQARGSIDYDWNIVADPTIASEHNYAAADNAWMFWATRMGLSKDNFWSSYRDLAPLGYGADSLYNGHDAELHGAVALLACGPVGLGDWLGMVNGTLLHMLARADGILLAPDRPLGPLDAMMARVDLLAGRLWGTHATVALENALLAPELSTIPSRRLVSHSGIDATLYSTVPHALAAAPQYMLQWLLMAVNVGPATAGLTAVTAGDLYPLPSCNVSDARMLVRSAHWPTCTAGAMALATGCLRWTSSLDLAESLAPCPGEGLCDHSFALWSVFAVVNQSEAPTSVGKSVLGDMLLLGDLTKIVPLSGFRFRLLQNTSTSNPTIVIVGAPGEVVPVTYLCPDGARADFAVHVRMTAVGTAGRVLQTLSC